MTDKLICPFCGKPLDIIDGDNDYLTCGNFHCCGGFCVQAEVWEQIISWKQTAIVLQKKLHKAMGALGYACGFLEWENETVCADELHKRIKEIEYIRE